MGGLAAGAAGLVLFGPRPRSDAPPGRIILDYWEKWTGDEGRAMRRLVERFNTEQDRIHVRYLTINSIDQKAMIAIAGGAPPDIIGLWNFNLPSFAESGALLPLDDLASTAGLGSDRYADAVWTMCRHEDRLWGMISTCGSLALYMNLDAIEAAGVNLEREFDGYPRTIDELDRLSDRLTERDAEGKIQRTGYLHTEPGWWSWPYGYHFGGTLVDPITGDATALTQPNIDAYRWVRSYPERYGSRELLAFQSGLGFYGTAQQPFLTGQVPLTMQGPWLANLVAAFRPGLRYRAVPMPVHESIYREDAPVGLLDGDVLVIPKGAPNPEASFAFIAWVQEQRQLEDLATAHGKNSPLRAVSPGFVENHTNRSVAQHNTIANSPRAYLFPRLRVWPRYVAEFDAGFQSLWLLQQTPDAMLARIQTTAQQAIESSRDRRARRIERSRA